MDENTLVTSADSLTPAQRYRKSEKCKLARERYYESKGRTKAQEYYQKNRDKILERSKNRYIALKSAANVE